MNGNNKKLLLVAVALAVLIAIFACIWFISRPGTAEGAKTITVEVVHADESKKTFTCHTDAEYLAEVLLDEGLAEGEESSYGLFLVKVDGEEAVFERDSAYWAVYQGGEYATVGISELPVHDGDAFSLVYTVG